MTQEETLQKLQTENEALKQRLEAIEQAQKETQKARWQWGKWWAGTLAWFIFGGNAKQSFEQIGKEIKEQQIPNPETLTVAGYHVLWRFVRVTTFAWVATIFTIIFIFVEIWLLRNQNTLLSQQNKLVTQQNLLSEASRRSSLVLLMSNVEDRVAEELKNNPTRQLSKPLIGRIIALCNSMKPYRYLGDGDTLTKEISPERGQMLLSLAYAGLDSSAYSSLFEEAKFDYADLQNSRLTGKYLNKANLSKANLNGASLWEAKLRNANLMEADLTWANLSSTNLTGANLSRANLNGANLIWANLSNADLIETNLSNADLSGADLSETKLDNAKVSNLGVFKEAKHFSNKYEIDTTKQKDKNGQIFYYVKQKKQPNKKR
jgi:hypothetical protein